MKNINQEIKKIEHRLQQMNPSSLKNVIKSIYDEIKHNRKITAEEHKNLKKLEKKVDQELEARKILTTSDKKDFENWKKNLEQGKKCY